MFALVDKEAAHTLLIEPHLFPGTGYMALVCSALQQGMQVVLEQHEHFPKQTLRNRYYILNDKGLEPLTVPLKFGNHTPAQEVTISREQAWAVQHWRTLEAAYRKAPYWQHYADKVHQLLTMDVEHLVELQGAVLSFCLESVGLTARFRWSETFLLPEGQEDSGLGTVHDARNLINKHSFRAMPHLPAYPQLFGLGFEPGLSMLDLLMNTGSEAIQFLPQYLLPA